ncbi:MAG: 1,4-alpha-glucan branching protein GlgB [Blautia sp.]
MAKSKTLKVTEMDRYLFGQGTHYEIYKLMGAHPTTQRGKDGVYFAVWAPHAKGVSVVGDFNGWDPEKNVMKCDNDMGIYQLFIPKVTVGDLYKFCITAPDGNLLYKADPYANYSEMRPGNASRVYDIDRFKWSDGAWMKKRTEYDVNKEAMSVYEVHPGSWKKHPAKEGDPDGFYNYRELAHELADYVHDMGYTHVELMGIAEHPFDGSWGYQVTGYYAPTSRYGTPDDFQYFINYMHKKKIGVILDWVPAHFPRDGHGLANFDGTPTYEYADPRKGEHPDWGTKVFDYAKNEVKNFLIANALFWTEHYHIDGLRVDAVASMLYLDYGRQDGQWVANQYGENKNLEAIEFFRHLNSIVTTRNQGVVMIAEESTAWPMVTGDPKDGGLGFSLKWNMGWMHDFLEYMKLDPYFRQYNHNKMTFSMTYAYSEKYVLVLSHDEVVHLKCSMINKMPGLGQDKFENLKAGYGFMFGHPGKKLLFMGQEFGQYQEWSEARELDWYLLSEPCHQQLQAYVKELLALYKKYPALYANDCNTDGFEWMNADDCSRSIYSFVRKSPTGRNNLLFVINYTPVARDDYRVGVPKKKQYRLILNSKDPKFGGDVPVEQTVYKAEKKECDGKEFSFAYPLPAYGVAVFVY